MTHADTEATTLKLSAQSALVYDIESGQIIFQKDAFRARPPASTLKLMTALILSEKWPLSKKIKMPASVRKIPPYKLDVRPGDIYSLEEMLCALLLRSANDVAHGLAIAFASTEYRFSKLMNQKAKSLGMNHSNFLNPHGLPKKGQYTTAYDLLKLVLAVRENDTLHRIMNKQTYSLVMKSTKKQVTLKNRNRLLTSGFQPVVLGKTGYTRSAGLCFAGYTTKTKYPMVLVLLKSSDRWTDLKRMASFGDSFYKDSILWNKKRHSTDTVKKIQTRLKELNLYQGGIDGVWGGGTQGAVLKFQGQHKVTVDGLVGDATLKILLG